MEKIFQSVFNPLQKEIKDTFCGSCAIGIFLKLKDGLPYTGINCKKQDKGGGRTNLCGQLPGVAFHRFRDKLTEDEIILFLNFLLKGKLQGQRIDKEYFQYIKNYVLKRGYSYNLRKRNPIERTHSYLFSEYIPEIDPKTIKSDDIPNLNNRTRNNALFFSRLYCLFYHLENSVRHFLKSRLISIHGQKWEEKILIDLDLKRNEAIRKETNLSNLFPKRGNTILNYCMWDDYGKIMLKYPLIFNKSYKVNEIVAHLNSMTKIRNAIAHNADTIPKENLDELDVFLKKFIAVFK